MVPAISRRALLMSPYRALRPPSRRHGRGDGNSRCRLCLDCACNDDRDIAPASVGVALLILVVPFDLPSDLGGSRRSRDRYAPWRARLSGLGQRQVPSILAASLAIAAAIALSYSQGQFKE